MNNFSFTPLRLALISFILTIIIAVLSFKVDDENSYLLHTVIGMIPLIIIILSIMGIIKSAKKINNIKKVKTVVEITINLLFFTLYTYLIIINI